MTTPDDRDLLADALAQAAFATMAALGRIGAEEDLSLTQLRVLGILRDRRLRMTELADHLGLEKSSLSGLVDRAQQRGLVERAPAADDRRAVEVFLSASGRRLAERLTARFADALEPLTAGLDAGERTRLRDLLERAVSASAGASPRWPSS